MKIPEWLPDAKHPNGLIMCAARLRGHVTSAVTIKLACWPEQRAMKDQSTNESWASLRETLGQQYRVTATFKQRDGKILHIRQATHPEEELGHIYTKLGISPTAGGLQRISI